MMYCFRIAAVSLQIRKEAAVSLKSLRNPVEILLPGTDFEMQFGDVSLSVSTPTTI